MVKVIMGELSHTPVGPVPDLRSTDPGEWLWQSLADEGLGFVQYGNEKWINESSLLDVLRKWAMLDADDAIELLDELRRAAEVESAYGDE